MIVQRVTQLNSKNLLQAMLVLALGQCLLRGLEPTQAFLKVTIYAGENLSDRKDLMSEV